MMILAWLVCAVAAASLATATGFVQAAAFIVVGLLGQGVVWTFKKLSGDC